MEPLSLFSQPSVYFVFHESLPRDKDRQPGQIIGRDDVLRRQRTVLPHEDPPDVLHGEPDDVVFRKIGRLDEHAEIIQASGYPFRYGVRVAAEEVEGHARMRLLEGARSSGDNTHGKRLAAADIDVTAYPFRRIRKLGLRFLHQRKNFPGPVAEEKPLLCEGNTPLSTQEERFPELLLEFHHLPRQRRLRHVQGAGSSADGPLPGHSQEITKHSQLHTFSLHDSVTRLLPCFISIVKYSI